MNIIKYSDRAELFAAVAAVVADDLRAALASGDRASLAVPGGTTPGPVFDVLAETDLEWDRVDVVLTDERWVDGDHPRSNTRLLYQHLLSEYAARANYLSLFTGDDTAATGAAGVSADVDRILPLSVVLLGMGADMHTASLFPNADNLAAALDPEAPAVLAITGGGAQESRVTLSARALNSARNTHLIFTGQDKRDALDRAISLNDPVQAPVISVLANATVHWAI